MLALCCNAFFSDELSGHPVHQVSMVWNVAADIEANKRDSTFGAVEQNYLIVC